MHRYDEGTVIPNEWRDGAECEEYKNLEWPQEGWNLENYRRSNLRVRTIAEQSNTYIA